MQPISLIIPWKASSEKRLQNLYNLFKCIDLQICTNDSDNLTYEVILVEQRTSNSLYTSVPSNYNHIILNTEDERFNKSWCVNVAMRNIKYNLALIIDADSLFNRDYIANVLKECTNMSTKIFIAWNTLIAEEGKDNPVKRIITPSFTRAIGGIWGVYKDFYFNELGGMNESFFGYGGEDNELYERACVATHRNNVENMTLEIRHQYHDWTVTAPNNEKYFLIGRGNANKVNQLLKKTNIGNSEHPTPIDMKGIDENSISI